MLAVCSGSVYIVITRHISPRNGTGNLMVWTALLTLVVMALAAPWYWVAPQDGQALGLIAIALMFAMSAGVTIKAYSIAPASLLAPFSYLEIVGAVLFGWFFWQEFPDIWTWFGATIIVASGLYVLRREAVKASG
ncbi:MAG: DMT family transporter [Alphaproteobacteria bacterium]|nr:DMT family transporter [Rhodospirillaceae bacterium]MBT6510966.1 DMT family transporter [Rhodospirillaceae bacterium]MBT7612594.1 DMT family transporter [Rhodospirillaceae bacterium]MBT7645556.1 DMT family transporter [Rhodospirillaceae bacterium]MDG2482990.1 DMT family transporter [Alphaproteobacteria bacterium]